MLNELLGIANTFNNFILTWGIFYLLSQEMDHRSKFWGKSSIQRTSPSIGSQTLSWISQVQSMIIIIPAVTITTVVQIIPNLCHRTMDLNAHTAVAFIQMHSLSRDILKSIAWKRNDSGAFSANTDRKERIISWDTRFESTTHN